MLQSVEGEEATGKTSYAYTAPLKIVGFAFDMGVERALVGPRHQGLFSACKIKIVPYGDRLTAVWQDNDITIYELPPPIQLDSIKVNGCRYLWSQFIVLAAEALQDNSVKTIVVDTMSVARRVKASAYLEALQDDAIENKKPMRERLLQIEWAAPNDAVRDLYTTAQGLKKNLIAVHHLTDERTDKVDKDGRVVQGVLT
ncbi:MAG: AAA family ATPase, partial [Candidatus Micrarchaeota archaeon]